MHFHIFVSSCLYPADFSSLVKYRGYSFHALFIYHQNLSVLSQNKVNCFSHHFHSALYFSIQLVPGHITMKTKLTFGRRQNIGPYLSARSCINCVNRVWKCLQSINQISIVPISQQAQRWESWISVQQQNRQSSFVTSTDYRECWYPWGKGRVKKMRFKTFPEQNSWGGNLMSWHTFH